MDGIHGGHDMMMMMMMKNGDAKNKCGREWGFMEKRKLRLRYLKEDAENRDFRCYFPIWLFAMNKNE